MKIEKRMVSEKWRRKDMHIPVCLGRVYTYTVKANKENDRLRVILYNRPPRNWSPNYHYKI